MLFFVHSRFGEFDGRLRTLLAMHQAEHRQYVDGFQDLIVVRGPTLDDKTGDRTSNVMIASFESEEAVRNFLKDEPLTKAGVFESITVERFDQRYPKSGQAS